ncbi:hypothetical protein SAMN05421676_11578 [Salinibacillus kushneri]|uniref:Uncharacterized protein n=1 Tax=Salinibacillus kushneri TaxID=237682 RepID=A0A1I0J2V3_9BACI|nr:hypothetical protein [Salinibacillus kushneri]SEU04012.1 hypothetical protein SAMN05421676_11578 [Salinibacillus kushneri]
MEAEPNTVKSLSNSQLGVTVAKQLWPSMLFLVVMSVIALFGIHFVSANIENQLHLVFSFWLWFIAMLTITGFGVYVFVLDARIHLQSHSEVQ